MNKIKANEKGIVTILSILLIIIIITVITLSLATLTRRELRQSLDEQLSSQALYAAESGVNDAVKALDPFNPSRITADVTDCSDTSQNQINPNRVLGDNVKYTCVLIDQSPESIATDLTPNSIKTYLIDDSAGVVDKLTFTWANTNNDSPVDFTPCANIDACFKPSGGWNGRLGILRLRLFKIGSPNNLSRSNFENPLDYTVHPYALTGGSISTGNNHVLGSDCNTTSCRVTLDVENSNYYLQAYTYYKDAKLTITGINDALSPVQFIGAQAEIDATGMAGDILRRIKVNIPAGSFNSESMPSFSVGSGDKLCKRFTTNPTITADSADSSECKAF